MTDIGFKSCAFCGVKDHESSFLPNKKKKKKNKTKS